MKVNKRTNRTFYIIQYFINLGLYPMPIQKESSIIENIIARARLEAGVMIS